MIAAAAIVAAIAISGGDDARKAVAQKPSAKTTAQPAPALPPGTPSDLNNRGYVLFQQNRYREALPLFLAAVKRCGSSHQLDPCGYALYNLGASLHRSGRSPEAIPILERRLRIFGDNETSDVRRELAAAIRTVRS